MVVEECSEKSSPGLDVRSLLAKSGPGKQSLYFVLKSKGGILVKALLSVYFCPFSSKSTIGNKIVETLYSNRVTFGNKRIHTPSPSPVQSWGVCCFLKVARSAAQHCLERMGKEKLLLFSPFEVFFFNIFY